MGKIWIDPPSGYLYGFPKVYNPDTDPPQDEWLIENGYPEKDVYSDWFYVRCWSAKEEEIVQDE